MNLYTSFKGPPIKCGDIASLIKAHVFSIFTHTHTYIYIWFINTYFVGNISKKARAHMFASNKRFQVFLLKINNSVKCNSFVCTLKCLDGSLWSINGTLIGATTLSQSGPEGNSNEEVIYIPQSSKTGASPSDSLSTFGQIPLGKVWAPLSSQLWVT